jgi:hypothetical protein
MHCSRGHASCAYGAQVVLTILAEHVAGDGASCKCRSVPHLMIARADCLNQQCMWRQCTRLRCTEQMRTMLSVTLVTCTQRFPAAPVARTLHGELFAFPGQVRAPRCNGHPLATHTHACAETQRRHQTDTDADTKEGANTDAGTCTATRADADKDI